MRFARCLLATLAMICLTSTAFAVQTEKMQVTVSIIPQVHFVKAIGGDLVNVTAMVAPGASPASYEPRPNQMAALSHSRIYFSIGVPFESAWLEKFRKAAPDTRFVPMHENIERMAMGRHDHEEKHGHAAEMHNDVHHDSGHALPDPHVWLSPPLVRIMAETVRDALIAADPANSARYHAGYAALCREIGTLDADILDIMAKADASGGTFFIFHPSFGYFARDYGLHQQAVEIGGKDPGPRDLEKLISLAKEQRVKVIFTAPQFSKRSAQTIAQAIGGTVEVANPLAADWAANLRDIASAFSRAAAK